MPSDLIWLALTAGLFGVTLGLGLRALVAGMFNVTPKRIVTGWLSRVIGLILLLPFPLVVAIFMIMAATRPISDAEATRMGREWAPGVLRLTSIICLGVALLIGALAARKPASRKRRSEDQNLRRGGWS